MNPVTAKEDETRRPLAVTIPTCSNSPQDIRIGYVLLALAMQPASRFFSSFDIYIWDSGRVPMTEDRWVRLTMDLVNERGHQISYLRRFPTPGVAAARRALFSTVPSTYDRILTIDDDLVPMPGAIDRLLQAAAEVEAYGFLQGTKIELDQQRTYHNDVNTLTARDRGSEITRIYFGDGAFLLVNRESLRHVRWDVVTRFQQEGLAGEDVALSLMIADHEACYGVPDALGYHMSLPCPRWRWEASSDALQIELLRDVVSAATLTAALPHLAQSLQPGPRGEAADAKGEMQT